MLVVCTPIQFLEYKSPHKDATQNNFTAQFHLTTIKLGVNEWNSKIVEGMTVLLWSIPVYLIFCPIEIIIQSIWMVPLHIYGGIYRGLQWLDSVLY